VSDHWHDIDANLLSKEGIAVKRLRNGAWILLFVLALIVALFSLGAILAGVDENEFESSTGISWTEIQETSPTVASYIVRLERLIGVGYVVVGITWAVISLRLLRRGLRDAWFIMWGMPLVFGGASAVFVVHEASGLGIYYGVFTVVAIVGLVLSYPGSDSIAQDCS